jgi:hypothetical protein
MTIRIKVIYGCLGLSYRLHGENLYVLVWSESKKDAFSLNEMYSFGHILQ